MKTAVSLISLCATLALFPTAPACARQRDAQQATADTAQTDVTALLRTVARNVRDSSDLDSMVHRAAQRTLVLLGEASHGTAEFYSWRADISRRLIEQEGFAFLAVEGDWAALYRLNRYVKGIDTETADAGSLMRGFDRWPRWMWANEEVAGLAEWLRGFNAGREPAKRVGFYGMDVYGAEVSLQKVSTLLAGVEPALREQLLGHVACLEPYAGDFADYARAATSGAPSCEDELRAVLGLLREHRSAFARDADAYFNLKQNARVLLSAARHYRAMGQRGPDSWNHRADHFFVTVQALLDHYGPSARGVVWAHNTHIGDARATTMAAEGKRNIGHIARERLGEDRVYAVGFGTYTGSVMAARRWGGTPLVMATPPAMPESYEELMKRLGMGQAVLLLDDLDNHPLLMTPRGHRAVGVIYHPEREAPGNYVPTVLTQRYNAFVFIDQTSAVRPLH